MSVDPRQRFFSGLIVTSQLCVAEKLLKKSKTNDRPQSPFRFSRPRLYFSIQLSLVVLSRLFSFSSPIVLFNSGVVGRPQSYFSIQSSLIVPSRPQSYRGRPGPAGVLFNSVVHGRFWSS